MTKRSSNKLIRQLLTGQPVTVGGGGSNKAVNFLLDVSGKQSGQHTGIGGGLGGLATTTPQHIAGPTSYAPGMRRQESVIGPNGQVLGLGPTTDPVAPPVMSGAKHPGMSMKHLGQLAQAAIAAQYDPVISALASQAGSTTAQAHKASRQVRRQGNRAVGDLAYLYGNLGREAGRAKRQSNRQYHQDIQGTRRSYHQLGHEVNTDYSTNMGSTAKELQRLGIDPSVALQGSARDQAFLNAQRANERQSTIGHMRQDKHDFGRMLGQARRDIVATGIANIGQSKSATRTALANIATNLADNLAKINMQSAQVKGQEAAAQANQRIATIQARSTARTARANNRLDRQYKKAQIAKLLGLTGSGPTAGNDYTSTGVGKGLAFLEANSNKVQHPAALANILQYITTGSGPGKQTPWDKANWNGPNGIWAHLVTTGKRLGWTQADMNYLQRAAELALGLG